MYTQKKFNVLSIMLIMSLLLVSVIMTYKYNITRTKASYYENELLMQLTRDRAYEYVVDSIIRNDYNTYKDSIINTYEYQQYTLYYGE